MKLILSLVVMGVFYTDSANSYISPSHLGGTVPWKKNGAKTSFVQPPSDVGLDDIFREEYLAWGKRYGKSTSDEVRFENFKVNFMLQMQHNKKTGTFNLLNEFGDSKFFSKVVDFRSCVGLLDENNNSKRIRSHNNFLLRSTFRIT